MNILTRRSDGYTRRDVGRLVLGGASAILAGATGVSRLSAAPIDSRIHGVQIGAITYSFRALGDAQAIVRAMVSMGLGEVELMSNDAEALAGAPSGPGNGDALRAWRQHATQETWNAVRRVFDS